MKLRAALGALSCFDAFVREPSSVSFSSRGGLSGALTRAGIGLSLGATTSACSFTFVDGPPNHAPRYESAPPREKVCTTSLLWPIVDSSVAALEGARAAVALASSAETYRKAGLSRGWEAGLGLGFAALFLSSAVYGFVETHECARYYGWRYAARRTTESVYSARSDDHGGGL